QASAAATLSTALRTRTSRPVRSDRLLCRVELPEPNSIIFVTPVSSVVNRARFAAGRVAACQRSDACEFTVPRTRNRPRTRLAAAPGPVRRPTGSGSGHATEADVGRVDLAD